MIFGGIVEIVLGIAAEGMPLQDVAKPLSVVRRAAESASNLGRLRYQ